jgi:Domain of unknown function (DUF4190)
VTEPPPQIPPVGDSPYQSPPSAQQPPYQGSPYGYQPYPYQGQGGTNGFAIASMVLGILWIFWLGSLLALVFGYIARQQIRDQHQGGAGMAVAGIVLGWIGAGTLLLVILTAAINN